MLRTLAAGALAAASCSAALGQCAMCRASVGNSSEAASMASGMNLAVLVLLVPPLLMFCAFFVAAYRFRKAPDEAASNELREDDGPARSAPAEADEAGQGGRRHFDGPRGPKRLAKAN